MKAIIIPLIDQNNATGALNEKVKSQISEMQNSEKEKIHQRAKKSNETVFIVGYSMMKKTDGHIYSLNPSIINSWSR